jgi:hypothetical protein
LGESVNLRRDDTLSFSMVSRGLDKAAVQAVWQPFLDWIAASPQDYRISGQPNIFGIPARNLSDAAYHKAHSPAAIISDPRPGAPPGDFSWAGDHDQIGAYWHGYESLWLPASPLGPDQQNRLADALFAASRHWTTGLHFNKGLAGAPPEAITASGDTATNPAVLTAFALSIIEGFGPPAYPGIPGHEPNLAEARNDAVAIGNAMAELRKLGIPRALTSPKAAISKGTGSSRIGAQTTSGYMRRKPNTIHMGCSLFIMEWAVRTGALTALRG